MKDNLRNFQKQMWYVIAPTLYNISPVLASKALFFFSMKQRLNLKNPKTFNEKIQWLKLYWQDPRVAQCADKYTLREYVTECGLDKILNPLYMVCKDPSEIEFSELPSRFALKVTNGCGYNYICKDKSQINEDNVRKLVSKWCSSRYAYQAAEVQYDKMETTIIVEKFIDGLDGGNVTDYKVFCFNGKPMITMVCEERGILGRPKYYFYDNSWSLLPYNNDSKDLISRNLKQHAPKPKSFDEMITYSKILSEPFPFVRVDFYEDNESPILGEMTFTPCGGIDSRLDSRVDRMMGDLIRLPKDKIL